MIFTLFPFSFFFEIFSAWFSANCKNNCSIYKICSSYIFPLFLLTSRRPPSSYFVLICYYLTNLNFFCATFLSYFHNLGTLISGSCSNIKSYGIFNTLQWHLWLKEGFFSSSAILCPYLRRIIPRYLKSVMILKAVYCIVLESDKLPN